MTRGRIVTSVRARNSCEASGRNRTLRHFEHAYTITRNFGPHCKRLECDATNGFATGCVATHLTAHVAGCLRLRAVWRDVTWQRHAWGSANKSHLTALFHALLMNNSVSTTLSQSQRKLVEYAASRAGSSRLAQQY